jgi:Antitoxin VbhA
MVDMALAIHRIKASERARRTRVYEEALASIHLEGLELDEQAKALYQRYIDGELTLAEVGGAIDELDNREFGSVPLSRRQRPYKSARSLQSQNAALGLKLMSG